jgi:hypothetical protein
VGSAFRRGRFVTAYPDCAHDFPPEVRQDAYRFLDQV